MPQIAADAAAEVQADTAGLPVGAAVAAGVAAVEDAGQILRRDADTGVADAEGGRGLRVDGDAAALGNEFVKMIFVSFLNSNIYPLKNLLTSRVCISLETPYSKASSHFPIASHLQ